MTCVFALAAVLGHQNKYSFVFWRGLDTRVIFEFPADNDNQSGSTFALPRKNNTDPINRSDVQVFVMDTNGSKLTPTGSSPMPKDNLIETSSGSTTAQSMFEFASSSGQNLLFAFRPAR